MTGNVQSTSDRKRRILRGAKANANDKYGVGGRPKSNSNAPKPVTLPKMPWDKKDTTPDE